MQVRFERIGMGLIGPLERSARGHRFALVLVDYATRYPEAVPQHIRKKCSGGPVPYDLPGGNPERDSHRSGHGVYITNNMRTL